MSSNILDIGEQLVSQYSDTKTSGVGIGDETTSALQRIQVSSLCRLFIVSVGVVTSALVDSSKQKVLMK